VIGVHPIFAGADHAAKLSAESGAPRTQPRPNA
jgi:hypothetical protein